MKRAGLNPTLLMALSLSGLMNGACAALTSICTTRGTWEYVAIMKAAASDAGASCCSTAESKTPELLTRLAELARLYNLNDYAASVKVFVE